MRLILIFVTLSILGIFLFQGYWVWNTYQIEEARFRKAINDTFLEAINNDLQLRMSRIKEDTAANKHGMIKMEFSMDNTSLLYAHTDSAKPYVRGKASLQTPKDSLYFKSSSLEQSTIAQTAFKGMWQALNNLSPVSLAQIDSLWSRYLQREGVYNRHFIDFSLGTDTLLATTLKENMPTYDLQATQRVGLNLDSSIGIQGFALSPEKSILKRLGLLFSSSLLLILITTACYLFLIRTILRQKSIAEVKSDFVTQVSDLS